MRAKVGSSCLHGWLDNAGSFIPLMRHLRKEEHWVALDLPGHGQSFHRPDGASTRFLIGF